VEFSQPSGVEAKLVAEFYLGENVLVSLLLRLPVGSRKLVEKPKPHKVSCWCEISWNEVTT
jgi:hypothetical protein